MNRNNDQISSAQLAAILSITIMGIGILSLPRTLVAEVGPDCLIVVVIGILIAMILGFIISVLVRRYPDDTIVDFGKTILGKFLGTLMSLGLFIFYIIFTAIEVRMFGEIAKTYLLLNTPLEVLMITFLIAVVYTVRGRIEPFARMSQIIFPIVLISSLLVMIPLIGELDLTYFLPVLKTPLMKIVKVIPLMTLSFLGLELPLLFAPFVFDKRNITKYIIFAVALVGSTYFATTLVTVSRFGLVETTHMTWPSLELFKTVDIPGAFIENIYIYVIAIWVFSVLMTAAGVYFGASLTLSKIIKSSEHGYLTLFLLPIIYYFAILPVNLEETIKMIDIFSNYLGALYLVIIPIGLLGLGYIRNQKGGSKNA
ncbi:MAG: GerAB/ArcD/ProY family transporter [Christensenellales bacterium]